MAKEKSYIRLEDYTENNPQYPVKSKDCGQTKWYHEVIQDSNRNRMELIREDPELAYKVFARYEDAEGLKLMAENTELDPDTQRIIRMQLESILSFEKEEDFERPTKHFEESLVRRSITERNDVIRRGHSPVKTDIDYHQADSIDPTQ